MPSGHVTHSTQTWWCLSGAEVNLPLHPTDVAKDEWISWANEPGVHSLQLHPHFRCILWQEDVRLRVWNEKCETKCTLPHQLNCNASSQRILMFLRHWVAIQFARKTVHRGHFGTGSSNILAHIPGTWPQMREIWVAIYLYANVVCFSSINIFHNFPWTSIFMNLVTAHQRSRPSTTRDLRLGPSLGSNIQLYLLPLFLLVQKIGRLRRKAGF